MTKTILLEMLIDICEDEQINNLINYYCKTGIVTEAELVAFLNYLISKDLIIIYIKDEYKELKNITTNVDFNFLNNHKEWSVVFKDIDYFAQYLFSANKSIPPDFEGYILFKK